MVAGVGAVLSASELAFSIVQYLGAGYLVILGVQGLIHSRPDAAVRPEPVAAGRSFRQGLVIGLANPRTAVFLAAVLPQFVHRGGAAVLVQLLLLGSELTLLGSITSTMWILLAATARRWLQGAAARARRLSHLGSITTIGVGAALALTRGTP